MSPTRGGLLFRLERRRPRATAAPVDDVANADGTHGPQRPPRAGDPTSSARRSWARRATATAAGPCC